MLIFEKQNVEITLVFNTLPLAISMIIVDNLCSISSSIDFEPGLSVECIVNLNRYISSITAREDLCIWESSHCVKVKKSDKTHEITNKFNSINGQRLLIDLLDKKTPALIIKISFSNDWLQSKGIYNAVQQNKSLLVSPDLSGLFSNFLDYKSISLFRARETYKLVSSLAFKNSILKYIRLYCDEVKKAQDLNINSLSYTV